MPPRNRPPQRNNNRALMIMIALAVIVALAAIIAVIVAVNSDSGSSAAGTSTGRPSDGRRGLVLTSPADAEYAAVTRSIRGLPTFRSEFHAGETSDLTTTQLRGRFWQRSVFPDETPAVCT